MRRAVALGCAAALIAALGLCGFTRWPLSAPKVGDSLNAAFGAFPRLHWRGPGSASFSALPWPSLHLIDARLDEADGANVVSAPSGRLDLSLIELLRGRFVPIRAVLVSPTATLDIDRPPFARAEGSVGPGSVAGAFAPLPSLSLSNGLLRVVSKRRGLDTLVANLSGRLDGLATGDQLRFDLKAVWRDAPVEIAGSVGDLDATTKGAPSPFKLAIAAPMARFGFDGMLVGGDAPSLDGDLSASITSMAALASLFGRAPPAVLASDDFAIAADVKVAPGTLTLGEATLTSGQQTFEGALEISSVGGRPTISGTLASELVALAPLLAPPERLIDPTGQWSVEPFAPLIPQSFDLDLRLSATALDIYGHTLSNAAASVMVKDGKLSANLIEAAAYDGRLAGEASVECVGETLKLQARAELADADLGAAFADVGQPVVSGRGGARFTIETFGDSPAAAVAHLSGSASLTAAAGGIAGVNLEEALRRSQRRPIDVARDMRLGGTAFDSLEASVVLDDGRARVEHGELTSRGVAAELGGSADLVARTWSLKVNAVQTGAAGEESQDAAHLTLDVDGPWSAPTIRAIGDGDAPPLGGGQAETPQ